MHYPAIDPIILALGPLAIRWYGLAYLCAFAAAWWLGNVRARASAGRWDEQAVSDVIIHVPRRSPGRREEERSCESGIEPSSFVLPWRRAC